MKFIETMCYEKSKVVDGCLDLKTSPSTYILCEQVIEFECKDMRCGYELKGHTTDCKGWASDNGVIWLVYNTMFSYMCIIINLYIMEYMCKWHHSGALAMNN